MLPGHWYPLYVSVFVMLSAWGHKFRYQGNNNKGHESQKPHMRNVNSSRLPGHNSSRRPYAAVSQTAGYWLHMHTGKTWMCVNMSTHPRIYKHALRKREREREGREVQFPTFLKMSYHKVSSWERKDTDSTPQALTRHTNVDSRHFYMQNRVLSITPLQVSSFLFRVISITSISLLSLLMSWYCCFIPPGFMMH